MDCKSFMLEIAPLPPLKKKKGFRKARVEAAGDVPGKHFNGIEPQWQFVDEKYFEEWARQQVIYVEDMKKRRAARSRYERLSNKFYHNKLQCMCGPEWYQELSPNQKAVIDKLDITIRNDLYYETTETTKSSLSQLGLRPLPNPRQIRRALKQSRGCSIEFLLVLYQLIKPDRRKYSINDRLLLSGVCHLALRSTLKEMHVRLPSPPPLDKEPPPPPKKIPYVKYASPYLVPYRHNKQKSAGKFKDPHHQRPECPYFDYVCLLRDKLHKSIQNYEVPDRFLACEEKIPCELYREHKSAEIRYNQLFDRLEWYTLIRPTIYEPCPPYVKPVKVKYQRKDMLPKPMKSLNTSPMCQMEIDVRIFGEPDPTDCNKTIKKIEFVVEGKTMPTKKDFKRQVFDPKLVARYTFSSLLDGCACTLEPKEDAEYEYEPLNPTKVLQIAGVTANNDFIIGGTLGDYVQQHQNCLDMYNNFLKSKKGDIDNLKQKLSNPSCTAADMIKNELKRVTLEPLPPLGKTTYLISGVKMTRIGRVFMLGGALLRNVESASCEIEVDTTPEVDSDMVPCDACLELIEGGYGRKSKKGIYKQPLIQLDLDVQIKFDEDPTNNRVYKKIEFSVEGKTIPDKAAIKRRKFASVTLAKYKYAELLGVLPLDRQTDEDLCKCPENTPSQFVGDCKCRGNKLGMGTITANDGCSNNPGCKILKEPPKPPPPTPQPKTAVCAEIASCSKVVSKVESTTMSPQQSATLEQLCRCHEPVDDSDSETDSETDSVEEEEEEDNKSSECDYCRKETQKMLKELMCPCDACSSFRRPRRGRKPIIGGIKELDDGKDIVPIVSGMRAPETCDCLEKFAAKLECIDKYKKRMQAKFDLKTLPDKYVISGVTDTKQGPIYNVATVIPQPVCACDEKVRLQEEREAKSKSLTDKTASANRVLISGVKMGSQENEFIIGGAMEKECPCAREYRDFIVQHNQCLQDYDKFLKSMQNDIDEYMEDIKDRYKDPPITASQMIQHELQQMFGGPHVPSGKTTHLITGVKLTALGKVFMLGGALLDENEKETCVIGIETFPISEIDKVGSKLSNIMSYGNVEKKPAEMEAESECICEQLESKNAPPAKATPENSGECTCAPVASRDKIIRSVDYEKSDGCSCGSSEEHVEPENLCQCDPGDPIGKETEGKCERDIESPKQTLDKCDCDPGTPEKTEDRCVCESVISEKIDGECACDSNKSEVAQGKIDGECVCPEGEIEEIVKVCVCDCDSSDDEAEQLVGKCVCDSESTIDDEGLCTCGSDQVCECSSPWPPPRLPKTPFEPPGMKLRGMEFKRYIILQRIPRGYGSQQKILKRLFESLAEDGFPLAKLPNVHRVPYFDLWMKFRTKKIWNAKDIKNNMVACAYNWNHLDVCRRKVKGEYPMTNKQMRKLTWRNAERVNKMRKDLVNDFFGQGSRNMVNFARESFPASYPYQYSSPKHLHDYYFAYSAGKEENAFCRNVWCTFEYKHISPEKRYHCC